MKQGYRNVNCIQRNIKKNGGPSPKHSLRPVPKYIGMDIGVNIHPDTYRVKSILSASPRGSGNRSKVR